MPDHTPGTFAAEHLSPAFPARAPWGTATRLRAWQQEALDEYFRTEPRDFLAAATPGAGKTTFALRLATELLGRRTVERVIVVAPTEHLKRQWAEAAERVGLRLDPEFKNSQRRYGRHYRGIAVTYAQVAAKASLHKELTEEYKTLVILDEVHHGGDALSWGDAVREAYERATRRLALTGTPFRSDTAPIPFVTYLPDEKGIRVSRTDYSYGYGRALADGVVRPVLFMVYAGHMRWRTRAGDEMEARLGEGNTKDVTAQAWRTALDPEGDWIPAVFRAATRRLDEVRQQIPDAGGLVIATDKEQARAYAALLEALTGERATVVLSDEKEASDRIARFAASDDKWMVAVRMVSEGVDVPRLAVGVYATNSSTPLFFAQAIGRFVRARRRGETASIFLPDVEPLIALAQALELERDHALDRDVSAEAGDLYNPEDAMMQAAEREEKASDGLEGEFSYQALGSQAAFDRVLFDGTDYGGYAEPQTEEELDFIGIPGLLEPEQVHELLMTRQARQAKRAASRPAPPPDEPPSQAAPLPLYRTLKEQRSLLNSLVGLYARVHDQPHGLVHAELRRVCGGPPVAKASMTQLEARIQWLRKKLGHA
ncbi:DEAD/DEAH box helicase [Gryllotalpicola ginsengisoli]|uniref:DEAD/DEAH box helicase n=1 Tax=Gryllotalpicola ginsengisoli TaxID=444608 RepID=UPI000483EBA3|nr:DEAD/DEAH box helicase [Gryllotalpicola ginsengisoli]